MSLSIYAAALAWLGGEAHGPMPTLAVEVNFTGPTSTTLVFGDATRGKFGTGTFGGGDDWVDVTEYVREGSISRGVSRFDGVYARAEAGTARIVLDNRDARFDPTNLAGPYVLAGVTQVRPRIAFRIRADGYDLWRGFADTWTPTYPVSGKDAIVTLTGTDGVRVLTNFNGVEQGSQGTGEDTGARVARILDNAGWPAADRDIDTGKTTVQATTLAQPAWTEILLASDTEIGEVYFSGAGKLVFRNRHAIHEDARSNTSQATFADNGTGLEYQDPVLATDDTQLANLVRIARVGGTEQSAEDTTAQTKYLKTTFERSDLLMESDAVALEYANYVLGLLNNAELRVQEITLDPRKDPDDLYPHALGRELGDRITVIFTPPGRAEDPIERDAFIRGIEHTFTPKSWRTRWTLQDASRFNVLVLDHPTLGVLDSNRLAY